MPGSLFQFRPEACKNTNTSRTPFLQKTSGWLLLDCFLFMIKQSSKARQYTTCWSSHRRRSVKKGVLKNSAIFTGKHLCWSPFFIKLKTVTPTKVFSCEYCEVFKNTYFENHLKTAAFEPVLGILEKFSEKCPVPFQTLRKKVNTKKKFLV